MSNLRPSVDIIIVNWNAGDFLLRCLESIPPARTAEFELKRVVVVDNASSDGSLNTIARLDLPLTVIRNTENRGFSAACNQGASGPGSDYLLFLNPDTCLYHDSLSRPIRFMEDPCNARVGICGIKLLDQVGEIATSCARFPSLSIYVSQMFGLNRFFPRYFLRHFLLPEELLESREVDQVIGAFFLVRRELFDRLSGFDERFFVYFEEVDLSLRMKQEGYVSYFLSDVNAMHIGRVSSGQVSFMALYYSLSSRLKYAMKHFGRMETIGLILLTFTVEFITRVFWASARSSNLNVGGVLSAYKLLAKSFFPWKSLCY